MPDQLWSVRVDFAEGDSTEELSSRPIGISYFHTETDAIQYVDSYLDSEGLRSYPIEEVSMQERDLSLPSNNSITTNKTPRVVH